ncbi:DUF3499 domain-containing protein [Flaviflexus massiliensis]|uniref:DUF3499 domain-containing protein n=1 Tax=Flaviflexus massiliensis TaxID=1522309 RepID=UPI0021C48E10|nr:DUF3499 domain-containing protein [Flaviflexus massiliensis]
MVRQCSRTRCNERAVVTMTYDYGEATAVVGPLSPVAQKGALDLCEEHAQSVTVPRGWSMVRLVTEYEPAPPSDNDLMALADAIKEASKRRAPEPKPAKREVRRQSDVPGQVGPSLRIVPNPGGNNE